MFHTRGSNHPITPKSPPGFIGVVLLTDKSSCLGFSTQVRSTADWVIDGMVDLADGMDKQGSRIQDLVSDLPLCGHSTGLQIRKHARDSKRLQNTDEHVGRPATTQAVHSISSNPGPFECYTPARTTARVLIVDPLGHGLCS